MKIFRYIAAMEDFNSIMLKENDWGVEDSLINGNPLHKKWKPLDVEEYAVGKVCDFPHLNPYIPIFSEKALNVLHPLLGNSIEPLPINYQDGNYFIINVLDIIDCLNKNKSYISYNSVTKEVSNIEIYSFDENLIKDKLLFKIPETKDLEVLVSEKFKKIVEKNGLTGLRFDEVVYRQKKK